MPIRSIVNLFLFAAVCVAMVAHIAVLRHCILRRASVAHAGLGESLGRIVRAAVRRHVVWMTVLVLTAYVVAGDPDEPVLLGIRSVCISLFVYDAIREYVDMLMLLGGRAC